MLHCDLCNDFYQQWLRQECIINSWRKTIPLSFLPPCSSFLLFPFTFNFSILGFNFLSSPSFTLTVSFLLFNIKHHLSFPLQFIFLFHLLFFYFYYISFLSLFHFFLFFFSFSLSFSTSFILYSSLLHLKFNLPFLLLSLLIVILFFLSF